MDKKKAGMVAIAVVAVIVLAYTVTACPMGWGYGYTNAQMTGMPMWWYAPWNHINQPADHVNQPANGNVTPWWYPWAPNPSTGTNPQPHQYVPCYHGWHRMGCW